MNRRDFICKCGAFAAATYLLPPRSRARAQDALSSTQTGVAADDRGLYLNRAPLQSTPYIALPLGSIRASGWLLKQLELQRDGLTGHAEELTEWLPALHTSAWTGGNGEGWEKGPYYLKGLVSLAYTLDDAQLKATASRWIEPILNSQQDNGFYGPKGTRDWWPRMLVNYLLRDYYEATGDARVIPFLKKYYGFLANPDYLKECVAEKGEINWGKARAADEIDTILWLYNRTGDQELLALATTIRDSIYNWPAMTASDTLLSKEVLAHNVNVPQAIKHYGMIEMLQAGAGRAPLFVEEDLLLAEHGQGLGITTGTEHLAGRSPSQGVETCATVERMLSLETNLRVFGEASLGDTLELVAFNMLPAAFSDDIHQHVYYTRPNHPSARMGGEGYWEDYADGVVPSPQSGYPCCCYNLHMGWPKFVQNSWAATADGGLAVLAYGPTQVSAKVRGGVAVTIAQKTDYPFRDTVRLEVTTPSVVRFPLELRVPAWCAAPVITVGGQPVPNVQPGKFVRIDRMWSSGDAVVATFPMKTAVREGYLGAVMVQRGPLVYSLQIDAEKNVIKQGVNGFDRFELTPKSPWNYALAVDPAQPDASLKYQEQTMPDNPFIAATAPVQVKARGRRLPDWTFEQNGIMAQDPPVSPLQSNEPEEDITLIPFGAQFLRMTSFPRIGTPVAPATTFSDDFSNPRYFEKWALYGGGWYRDDTNALICRSQAPSKIVVPGASFQDLVYEVEIFPPEKGDAGVIFRGSGFGLGGNDFHGYYAGLTPERNMVVLGKCDGGWTEMKRAPFTFTADQSVKLRVEAKGSQISVYLADQPDAILQAEDSQHASGTIGLRLYTPRYVPARFKGVSARSV
jgi:hypothetical protein